MTTELAEYFAESWAGYSSFVNPQITELPASAYAGTKARLVIEAQNSSSFVTLSPRMSPDLVADDVEMISLARNVLGPELSAVVPEVLFFGWYDGRSVAAFELLNDLPTNKVARKLQKTRIGNLVTTWVDQVGTRTLAPRRPNEFESAIERPLKWLIANEDMSAEVRKASADALHYFENDPSKAKTVFMHGDLWWGNIMLPPSALDSPNKFYLIDWGGAERTGYPVYDLVRVLDANGRRATQTAIDGHLAKLDMDREQGLAHVLSAAGSFGVDGDQLTPLRARELAQKCWETYNL